MIYFCNVQEHGAKVSRDPVGISGALNADENLGRPTWRSTHGYAWPVKEVLAGLQAALKRGWEQLKSQKFFLPNLTVLFRMEETYVLNALLRSVWRYCKEINWFRFWHKLRHVQEAHVRSKGQRSLDTKWVTLWAEWANHWRRNVLCWPNKCKITYLYCWTWTLFGCFKSDTLKLTPACIEDFHIHKLDRSHKSRGWFKSWAKLAAAAWRSRCGVIHGVKKNNLSLFAWS